MSEKSPQYFYTGNVAPSLVINKNLNQKSKQNNDKDLLNPIFNFDKSFSDNLYKITPLELAQSEPYIKLEILDLSGKVIDNLNISFFHKQIDFTKIAGPERYNDRPLISLKGIDITTDQASGYKYHTMVKLDLKIHKKNQLSDRTVLGLIFPGCPLSLEYGWNSPNTFLNKTKQRLLLNVSSYDIVVDETGQSDLIVNCFAFNDIFGNVIIGDLTNNNKDGLGGLFDNYTHLSKFLDYLDSLKKNGNNNVNDYSHVVNSSKDYISLEKIVRGDISKNFSSYIQKLSDPKLRQKVPFGQSSQKEIVSLHDVIYTLCDETFKSMTSVMPVSTFEVIYGTFNDFCLDFSGESIADFPIDFQKLKNWLNNKASSGKRVVYINDLLTELSSDFLTDQEYLKGAAGALGGINKKFQVPEIAINFFNTGDILTLSIIDAKAGIPTTTNELPLGKAPSGEVERKFADKNLAIINLGNANSFIKNVSFSRITDPNVETVLIERALQNSYFTPRDPVLNDEIQKAQPTTPLSLPLQRFYESTWSYRLDAI